MIEKEHYFEIFKKDNIEDIMIDFRKENYSDEFLNDLENGLNHINSIHASIDDVCIEEVTKRKDDIECHNIKLVNGDDVFSKITQRLKT